MRINESLWRQVKSKAALEGVNMGKVIEELLRMLLNSKLKIKCQKEVVLWK